jgi:hypothetical protein
MITLFAIAAATNVAVAGDKPDFSGTWKVDLDKSVLGPLAGPTSITRRIEHKDPNISDQQSITGPDMNLTFKYSTDGQETANNFMGTDFKSKAQWEGKTLVIHNDVDGGKGKSTNKWSLSAEGKTLTDVLTISSPDGDFEVIYVLVKQ